MAAFGANISKADQLRCEQLFWQYMGFRSGSGRKVSAVRPRIFRKAGVPASNTAADSPGMAPCLILDTTNFDVYMCTAFTNSTTFTIIKISP